MGSAPSRESTLPRTLGKGALAVLLMAASAGATWWAAHVTLTEPSASNLAEEVTPVWATAAHGSVGRTLPFATTLEQPILTAATNHLAGVVTATHPGIIDVGDALYVVGNTPARAVELSTPMWRELRTGTSGDDVVALQQLLTRLGHFEDQPNGRFGRATQAAVNSWQKAEGRSQTGIVQLGELVSLPTLPMQITLGESIVVGASVAGGEEAVLAPSGEYNFTMVLTEDQSRLVPTEASITITHAEHTWQARIAGSRSEFGTVVLELVGADGSAVCGSHCDSLPATPTTTLRSEVIVVPPIEGVTIPVAALLTQPDGSVQVMTPAGAVTVSVLGSGQGLAVVSGIESGEQVQLSTPPAAQTSEPQEEEE